MGLELIAYRSIGMTWHPAVSVTNTVKLIANMNVFVMMDMLEHIVNLRTVTLPMENA